MRGIAEKSLPNGLKWVVFSAAVLLLGVAAIQFQGWTKHFQASTNSTYYPFNENVGNLEFALNLLQDIPEPLSYLHPNYRDVTVVTGYFDIGQFAKKWNWRKRDRKLYKRWLQAWSFIGNKVFAYFDDREMRDEFLANRAHLPLHLTNAILIRKEELESYKLLENITKIYSNPGYPKITPDTVIPEYPVATSTKFDLIVKTAEENRSENSFLAWVDIGIFNYQRYHFYKVFNISLPNGFDSNRIVFPLLETFAPELDVTNYFLERTNWLGTGTFLGTRERMAEFSKHYQFAFRHFTGMDLACNDQAVLYGMLLPESRGGLGLGDKVQIYDRIPGHDRGFEIGYLFETTWRYPIVVCSEQIDENLRKTCLGMKGEEEPKHPVKPGQNKLY